MDCRYCTAGPPHPCLYHDHQSNQNTVKTRRKSPGPTIEPGCPCFDRVLVLWHNENLSLNTTVRKLAFRSVSVPSSLVPKSLTPVTSALEKFLLREDDEEEGKCDHEGDSSSGRPSNSLYIPKSASAEAALSGKRKEEREESPTKDNLPESGLEKY